MQMRITYLEDDPKLSQLFIKEMKAKGHEVNHFSTIEELQHVLDSSQSSIQHDLFILDRMIGKFDVKLWLLKNNHFYMKKINEIAPILILSAVNTAQERAELIEAGVDDYLGKPFSTLEVFARIQSLVRRRNAPQNRGEDGSSAVSSLRQLGNTILDLQKRILLIDHQKEILPAKEFQIIQILSDNIGKVYSRNDLLDRVWESNLEVETHVVETTVTHLRKRLSTIGSSIKIKNMRNAGYWIEVS